MLLCKTRLNTSREGRNCEISALFSPGRFSILSCKISLEINEGYCKLKNRKWRHKNSGRRSNDTGEQKNALKTKRATKWSIHIEKLFLTVRVKNRWLNSEVRWVHLQKPRPDRCFLDDSEIQIANMASCFQDKNHGIDFFLNTK